MIVPQEVWGLVCRSSEPSDKNYSTLALFYRPRALDLLAQIFSSNRRVEGSGLFALNYLGLGLQLSSSVRTTFENNYALSSGLAAKFGHGASPLQNRSGVDR